MPDVKEDAFKVITARLQEKNMRMSESDASVIKLWLDLNPCKTVEGLTVDFFRGMPL